jgi:hypothetical protein
MFPGFVTAQLLPISENKKCSERLTFCEHCKNEKNADRGIKKWFPGMLPRAL